MAATFETLTSLGIPVHDYEEMTYTIAGSIETITYKRGGASGTTVATVTFTYDLAGNLETVTRT